MSIGERIKAIRLEKGLTLEEVGNRVGVGKSTVRKWETGDIANMRRDKIALLANALNVSPTYLMGWDDNRDDDPRSDLLKQINDLAASLPPEKLALAQAMLKAIADNK